MLISCYKVRAWIYFLYQALQGAGPLVWETTHVVHHGAGPGVGDHMMWSSMVQDLGGAEAEPFDNSRIMCISSAFVVKQAL